MKPKFGGLSPSSYNLYQSCPRKFYFHKLSEVPKDSNAEENTDAFDVGKVFHKCCEDRMHNLEGLTYFDVVGASNDIGMNPRFIPMVFAMLRSYKSLFETMNLSVLACEIPIETKSFIGFVDAVMLDSEGMWWVADLKTSASLSKMLVPTLPQHVQLNLYASHAKYLADKLDLSLSDFAGVRYLLTTKCRLKQRVGEGIKDFINRQGGSISSYDFAIRKEDMSIDEIATGHRLTVSKIKRSHRKNAYSCNFNSCTTYFRPCEWFSQCHKNKEFESD